MEKKGEEGKNSTRRHSSAFLGGRSFTGKLPCRNRLMAGGLSLGSFPRVFLALHSSIVIRGMRSPSFLPASLLLLMSLALAVSSIVASVRADCNALPSSQLFYLTAPRSSFVVLASSHILLTRSAHLD